MSRLCIVTAFAAETRPFLDRWQFKASQTRSLRTYESDDYLLVQTGTGKLKAAASVSAALQAHQDITTVVNIGIAGADQPIGSLLLAHKVKDQATGFQWYPHLPKLRNMNASAQPFQTTAIHTLDQPSSAYQEDVAFDMEASGVFAAASLYLTTNQIHSIKVISDNSNSPVELMDKNKSKTISNLLFDRLTDIEALLECLHDNGADHSLKLQQRVLRTSELLLKQAHHSLTEKVMLQRLLERIYALGADPELHQCQQLMQAKAIRQHLEQQLSTIKLCY